MADDSIDVRLELGDRRIDKALVMLHEPKK
jgi:hypothetical protein